MAPLMLMAFLAIASAHAQTLSIQSAEDLAKLEESASLHAHYNSDRLKVEETLSNILAATERNARTVRLRSMDPNVAMLQLVNDTKKLVESLRLDTGEIYAEDLLPHLAQIITDSVAHHHGVIHPSERGAEGGPFRTAAPKTSEPKSESGSGSESEPESKPAQPATFVVPLSQVPTLVTIAQLAALHIASLHHRPLTETERKELQPLGMETALAFSSFVGVFLGAMVTSMVFDSTASLTMPQDWAYWAASVGSSTALGSIIGYKLQTSLRTGLSQRHARNQALVLELLTGFYRTLDSEFKAWGMSLADQNVIATFLESKEYDEARAIACKSLMEPRFLAPPVRARVAEAEPAAAEDAEAEAAAPAAAKAATMER